MRHPVLCVRENGGVGVFALRKKHTLRRRTEPISGGFIALSVLCRPPPAVDHEFIFQEPAVVVVHGADSRPQQQRGARGRAASKVGGGGGGLSSRGRKGKINANGRAPATVFFRRSSLHITWAHNSLATFSDRLNAAQIIINGRHNNTARLLQGVSGTEKAFKCFIKTHAHRRTLLSWCVCDYIIIIYYTEKRRV